jgi:hypothetical protein
MFLDDAHIAPGILRPRVKVFMSRGSNWPYKPPWILLTNAQLSDRLRPEPVVNNPSSNRETLQ